MSQDAVNHFSLALQGVLATQGEQAARDLFAHELAHYRTRRELTEAIYAKLLALPVETGKPEGNLTLKLKRSFRGVRTVNISINT